MPDSEPTRSFVSTGCLTYFHPLTPRLKPARPCRPTAGRPGTSAPTSGRPRRGYRPRAVANASYHGGDLLFQLDHLAGHALERYLFELVADGVSQFEDGLG